LDCSDHFRNSNGPWRAIARRGSFHLSIASHAIARAQRRGALYVDLERWLVIAANDALAHHFNLSQLGRWRPISIDRD
jgi:hypothetical protein